MPSEHDEIPLLSQQEQDNDQEQGASTGPKPFSEDPARPSLHALSRPNSPPSYDEAVFSQSRSFLRRTLPAWARSARRALPDADSLRQFAGKAGGACVRYLPTNRFAQAAYFLVGLWLLFVLTRATLQAPGPVREYEDFVLPVDAPFPPATDGHIVSNATWAWRSCESEGEPLRWQRTTYCTADTSFFLSIPHSFATTERLFLFADPPRSSSSPVPQPRGAVAGSIRFVYSDDATLAPPKGEEQAGLVRVDVSAKYEEQARELLDKATVVQMARGFHDQGFGIYTYPLPARFRYDYPSAWHPHAPLAFTVTVHVPRHAAVPAFVTETSAMDIYAFTPAPTPETQVLHEKSSERTRASQRSLLDSRGQPDEPTLRFGKWEASTENGRVVSSSIKAEAHIRLRSGNGDVTVDGDLRAPSVQLSTSNGAITIAEGALVEAENEAILRSANGGIALWRDSSVRATKVIGKASNGKINGDGVWHGNHTLALSTSNGALKANVAVSAPHLEQLSPEERRDYVEVSATSSNGAVSLRYTEHEAGVPLCSRAHTPAGSADVTHHPHFAGSFMLDGSRMSDIILPSHLGKPHNGRTRRLKVEKDQTGWISKHVEGRIWYDDQVMHESARTEVDSSLGRARLTFN